MLRRKCKRSSTFSPLPLSSRFLWYASPPALCWAGLRPVVVSHRSTRAGHDDQPREARLLLLCDEVVAHGVPPAWLLQPFPRCSEMSRCWAGCSGPNSSRSRARVRVVGGRSLRLPSSNHPTSLGCRRREKALRRAPLQRRNPSQPAATKLLQSRSPSPNNDFYFAYFANSSDSHEYQDLPWSTCAMTDIERMFRGLDWISCSWVRVKLTCAAGAARSEKGAPARARRADSCE